MGSETAKRALRAAAKVAFGASFVGALPGCGGKAETREGKLSANDPSAHSALAGGASIADAPDYPTTVAGGSAPVATQPIADAAAAPVEAAVPVEADAGSEVDAAVEVDEVDSGLRCVGEVKLAARPEPSTPVSADEFACCASYTSARNADATDAGQLGTLGDDPSFVNCCRAIISGYGAGILTPHIYEPVRHACCFSDIVAPERELWEQSFCAPWGPPVPPPLAFELEALA